MPLKIVAPQQTLCRSHFCSKDLDLNDDYTLFLSIILSIITMGGDIVLQIPPVFCPDADSICVHDDEITGAGLILCCGPACPC